MDKIFLDSLRTYNRLYGLQTRHPLVAEEDLHEAENYAKHFVIKGEIYNLFLKNALVFRMDGKSNGCRRANRRLTRRISVSVYSPLLSHQQRQIHIIVKPKPIY